MHKIIVCLLIVMLFAVPAFSQSGTVADIVSSSADFSTLLAAAESAGLVGALSGGTVTVFAPRNGAFQTLLNDLGLTEGQLVSDVALMREVVSYHVVSGQYTVGDIITNSPLTLTTLNGAEITLTVVDNRVRVNGGAATVSQSNVFATNGVIHVIDNVLLPPTADTTPVTEQTALAPVELAQPPANTVLAVLAPNPDLSLFLAAVDAAGYTDTISTTDPVTVFAPTNGAFITLINQLGMSQQSLLADTTLLQAIVSYHVLPGRYMSDDLYRIGLGSLGPQLNGGRLPAVTGSFPLLDTLNGKQLHIGVNENFVVLDYGRAAVRTIDVPGSNGVVHLIDNVLVP